MMDLSFATLDAGKPVLCLDFDGVLHQYSRGYHDSTIYDPPTEGALSFVHEARKSFNLIIFTARARTPQGRDDIGLWLIQHGFPLLPVTCEKPPAFLTLDDRAMTFTGTWPKISELRKFKPWNGQLWGTRDFSQEDELR